MDIARRLALAAGSLGLAALVALPTPALGQGDGFLFQRPQGTFTLRVGVSRPNASGDPFSDFMSNLTLSRSSFVAFDVAGDLAFTLAPRLDLVLGTGWEGSQSPSEERHWTDQNNQPIRQTTTLQRVPITASLKLYLRDRGRSVGRFAWVPASGLIPYVGAGGGMMYSRIHQWGNFVGLDTIIHTDDFSSESWTGTVHAFAGVEAPLGPRWVATLEARYSYAKTSLNPVDFWGFGDMDLSGFSVTAGLGVRF
jgi:opacity protein-like surface antigen